MKFLSRIWFSICLCSTPLFAFEDTRVLPKGIRNLGIRSVNANISRSALNNGEHQELAAPLERSVTFGQLAKTKTGTERKQVEGFLINNGFASDDELGHFTADMKGSVRAVAPVFAYGITDRWTMGVALPVYSAKTSVDIGFKTNSRGQDLLNLLGNSQNNNVQGARDAAAQMNNLISKLQSKLVDNGYDEVNDWSKTGMGDLLLVSRAKMFSSGMNSGLWSLTYSAPTGYVESPDILNDISFGNGYHALGAGVSFDQGLAGPWFLNEYASYTNTLPSQKKMRMKTPQESIEVPVDRVSFDAGDKWEAGASLQADTEIGFIAGTGLVYQKKYADRIKAGESSSTLEANTEQEARIFEALFGYSSVNAFRRGESKIPYSLVTTYKRQLWSRNQPVAHQLQFDVKVFF